MVSVLSDSKREHYESELSVKMTWCEFVPSIGFLNPELKKYLPNEVAAIISAYKGLVRVVEDKDIQALMTAEVGKIENDLL